MAMSRSRRPFRRGFTRRGPRNNPRWTGFLLSDVVAGGAVFNADIVSQGMFQTSPSLESECTFLRLRGTLTVLNIDGLLSSTIAVGVREAGAAEGVGDLANVANLRDSDILYYRAFGLGPVGAGADSMYREDVDIRVRRRLEDDHRLVFSVSNVVGGGDVTFIFGGRSLLRLRL